MGDEDGGHGRKRNYDGGDSSSPQKKSFMNDPDAVYLKFMVPQATAGSVIGKGGQNISDLQKEFGVHIRMSKANDVFPGSDSRVALMSGKVNNVLSATMVIFKRMTSPSDLFPKNPRPKSVSDKELSLIVPQSTAGLIIGKGGSRVKSIQEEANCHINLTQKTEQLPSNERVVTIQNNESSPENIEKALKLILDVIKTDPQSGSCLTINYTNPDGDRPVGHHQGHHHNSRRDDYNDDYYDEPPHRGGGGGRNWDRGNNNGGGNMGGMGMGGGGGGRGDAMSSGPATNAGGFPTASGYPPQVHFWCTFSGPPIANGHTPPPHMIEGMKTYLLNVGYPPKAIQEIIAASNILASYGILKPGNISIFNTPQIQATNPFNTMSGNGSDALGLAGLGGMGGGGGGGSMNSMGGGGLGGGWNNSMGGGGGGAGNGDGMFMNKFQQGGASNRGLDGGFGFDSGYMSGMGGGMNSSLGGYGKNDSSINDVKRRF